jgi:glycosyltransferase involved in cell wall biosynthesis
MRIVFLLPGRSPRPAGGFKVVYEYANRLAARGHELAVVHPWSCEPPASRADRWRARLWVASHAGRRRWIVPWLEVDREVALPLVSFPGGGRLPDADAVVATAWQTAPWVAEATRAAGRGFYLVQGYEDWDDVEQVRASWRLPLRKVAISGWLQELLAEAGEGARTSLVPNGVDRDEFGVDVPPEERPARVGALLSPHKGEEAAAVLEAARARFPELEAATFGATSRPDDLPAWASYERLPDGAALRRLYNSCSIFLQASRAEGWGLPATEAMACGCALVTYDNGGSREYAADGETAVVVAEHEPDRLVEAVVALAGDRERRLALARRGRERVARLSWEDSTAALERVLAGEGAA